MTFEILFFNLQQTFRFGSGCHQILIPSRISPIYFILSRLTVVVLIVNSWQFHNIHISVLKEWLFGIIPFHTLVFSLVCKMKNKKIFNITTPWISTWKQLWDPWYSIYTYLHIQKFQTQFFEKLRNFYSPTSKLITIYILIVTIIKISMRYEVFSQLYKKILTCLV